MKSRQQLLAEIEEKLWKNNEIDNDLDTVSLTGPDAAPGYDPYDNPGRGKEVPDGTDITARRRKIRSRRGR